jgi:hypothetical protein
MNGNTFIRFWTVRKQSINHHQEPLLDNHSNHIIILIIIKIYDYKIRKEGSLKFSVMRGPPPVWLALVALSTLVYLVHLGTKYQSVQQQQHGKKGGHYYYLYHLMPAAIRRMWTLCRKNARPQATTCTHIIHQDHKFYKCRGTTANMGFVVPLWSWTRHIIIIIIIIINAHFPMPRGTANMWIVVAMLWFWTRIIENL